MADDGIGKEAIPEGLRVMDTVARKLGIDLHFDHFELGLLREARQNAARQLEGADWTSAVFHACWHK